MSSPQSECSIHVTVFPKPIPEDKWDPRGLKEHFMQLQKGMGLPDTGFQVRISRNDVNSRQAVKRNGLCR
jgi:hypothetical protein